MSPGLPTLPYVIAHDARIPKIGLGTMTLTGEDGLRAIETALDVGYRHLDTAAYYGNEKEIGEALRASGLKREDVFITTKVWPTDAKPDDFARAVDRSLEQLQLSSVDLLLIHWPSKDVPLQLTVGALCSAKKEGKAKHVGVANFTIALLDEAWHATTVPLVCNPIECHPFNNQDKVIAASVGHGMAVIAHAPIARGRVFDVGVLSRIGATHGKTAAQVSMRYLIERGIVPIPRSASRQHLIENLDVFDFELCEAEMAELTALGNAHQRVVNSRFAPVWDTP